jgi:hypothetical protein
VIYLPPARQHPRHPAVPIWFRVKTHIIDPVRQVRLSYLPPLPVYMAAGISGLTGIVGTLGCCFRC